LTSTWCADNGGVDLQDAVAVNVGLHLDVNDPGRRGAIGALGLVGR